MRILIVDDQADFRSGLRDVLSTVEAVEVVGEAADGKSAIAAASRLKPEIILMDIRMPAMNGIAATAAIHSAHPSICILVLTTFDEDRLIHDAMTAGAAGYILKGTSVDDIVSICGLALRGYIAIGPRGSLPGTLTSDFSEEFDKATESALRLSDRERDVWSLLGQGATNREIAQRLLLTEGTIKNYVTAILAALGLRHRTEAALLWRSLHLRN
jgi:DNA-binding NarL/FixJ family response regulator